MGEGPAVVNQARQAEAAAVAELMKKYIEPRLITAVRGEEGEVQVLVAGDGAGGVKLHNLKPLLDEYLTNPERRKGTAQLGDLASFIAHVIRFKDEDSVLFADPTVTAPKLTAVLDYHRKGPTADPRFLQHRAIYPFPLSDEWKAWKAKDGQEISQQEFAEFLEDRISDVADPAEPGESAKTF